MFGISSGAVLAVDAAAQGSSIRKMAIYEPPIMVEGGGHRPPADSQAHLSLLISEGRRGDAVKFMMTKVMGMPAMLVAIIRLLPAGSKLEAVAHTLPYDVAITTDSASIMKRAATITVPALVAGGQKSPPFLRLAVQTMADVIPHAQRRMLAGQTHNVSAKLLAPVLIEFFTH